MSAERLRLGKYSLGVGDRFAHQARGAAAGVPEGSCARRRGRAGLEQVQPRAQDHRHSQPAERPRGGRRGGARAAAGSGRTSSMPTTSRLATVDRFLAPCDFFTLDVADFIGAPPAPGAVDGVRRAASGAASARIAVAGIAEPSRDRRAEAAARTAAQVPGRRRGGGPHLPAHRGRRRAPARSSPKSRWTRPTRRRRRPSCWSSWPRSPTRASRPRPSRRKFTGRFNKGVDYVGDVGAVREGVRARTSP